MKQAGLNNKEVSIHTGLRFLRSKGYKYIQSCQKGLLTESDLRKRFQFAKEMKEYNYNVWTEKIAIFSDAVLCTCLTPQSKHVLVEGVYGERKARTILRVHCQNFSRWQQWQSCKVCLCNYLQVRSSSLRNV